MKRNLDSYCRLCSHNKGRMINIFDQEGREQNICSKINTRLSIQVFEDDILPKTICIVCYGMLDKFDDFINKVQKNQARLTIFYIQTELEYMNLRSHGNYSDDVIIVENGNEVITIIDDDDDDDVKNDSNDVSFSLRKRKADQHSTAISNKRFCAERSSNVINEIQVIGTIKETIDKRLETVVELKSELLQELKTQLKNQQQQISEKLDEHARILASKDSRRSTSPSESPNSKSPRRKIPKIIKTVKVSSAVNGIQRYIKVSNKKECDLHQQTKEIDLVPAELRQDYDRDSQKEETLNNDDSAVTSPSKLSDGGGAVNNKILTEENSVVISNLFGS